MGDNGAGKSTTVNLISGIHKPTDGYLSVDGKKTTFSCRSDSADAGIETIYQHTALVDSLSITRNIFMGRELTDRFGFLRQREMRDIAMEVLQNAVHISGIDSRIRSSAISPAGRNRRSQSPAPSISRSACCSSMSRPRRSPYARRKRC